MAHFSHLFPGFMLGKFPTEMSPWNFHNYITFYHKNVGGTKDIMSPLSKSSGDMSPHPL